MKLKHLLLFWLVLIFSVNSFSQGFPVLKGTGRDVMPDDFTVGAVKGKIINKPASLPKPQYPTEAKQAGVEGTVRVQIKVDEEGNVTEAFILSGPELLQSAALETAQKTRFVGYRDSNNQFIKTEGSLTYTFEIQKASWSSIGYGLNMINILPVVTIPLPAFAKAIEPEWTEERQIFDKLKEIQAVQLAHLRFQNGAGPVKGTQASVITQLQVPAQTQPAYEQAALGQNLISALQIRLKDDKLNLWRFELGINLSQVLRSYGNPFSQGNVAKMIKDSITHAPAGVKREVLVQLDMLLVLLQKESSHSEINEALAIILKDK